MSASDCKKWQVSLAFTHIAPYFHNRQDCDLGQQKGRLSHFSDLHKIKSLYVPSISSFLHRYSEVLAYLGLILSARSANCVLTEKEQVTQL